MAYQRVVGLICFLLLVFYTKNATQCKISLSPDILRVSDVDGPLIYDHDYSGIPSIKYPYVDTNCIFESGRLHLGCHGPDSKVQFNQKVGNETRVVNATASSVYLLYQYSGTPILVHRGPSFEAVAGNFIKCSSQRFPSMFLNSTNSSSTEQVYRVGYRLNEMDLLKVYDQVFRDEEWVVTRYKIIPNILNKPKFSEGVFPAFPKSGLFYSNKELNFTELYSQEYQIAAFQNHFQDLDLTEKYFSDKNVLVAGQLLPKDDVYYFFEQTSTYFYENTAPIWKSVYEGNWKNVANEIREIADNTASILNIYVAASPGYHASWTDNWVLGSTPMSPDIVPVPEILVKAAVGGYDRGIVFHTFNDPHLDPAKVLERLPEYCSKTTDCNVRHREFENVYKGYTFCCLKEDSYIFKQTFE